MNAAGWIQILLFVVGLVLITKPMGIYLLRVLDPEKEGGLGILEKVFGPVERLVYAAAGVNPRKQHNWKQYAVALLVFGMMTMLISYLLFRMQALLPGQAHLNPQNFPAMSDTLSFIQAASFMTNTDWQSYVPDTPFSDYIQVLSFFAIPAGLVYYYGRMIKNTRHAWNIWAAMFVLLIAGIVASWHFESQPNPRLTDLGIDPGYANMEGKDVRHGIFRSTVWADQVTATAAGANNCQHDSLMPLTGFVTMFNMHLGEVVFGGIGSGLYGVLIFIFVAVFLAGLMIGRTPEYLGKKIEGYDVKLAAFFLLLTVITSCGFIAYAVITKWGTDGMNNNGPHGFSEVLYAYSSATANNGSAFGGLTCTPANLDRHYNISMAFCILFGRFFQIIPVMGLAGALARKKPLATSNIASFPVTGFTFVSLVVSVILIVGALNFFPSLALGPIVEHFVMNGSKVLY